MALQTLNLGTIVQISAGPFCTPDQRFRIENGNGLCTKHPWHHPKLLRIAKGAKIARQRRASQTEASEPDRGEQGRHGRASQAEASEPDRGERASSNHQKQTKNSQTNTTLEWPASTHHLHTPPVEITSAHFVRAAGSACPRWAFLVGVGARS